MPLPIFLAFCPSTMSDFPPVDRMLAHKNVFRLPLSEVAYRENRTRGETCLLTHGFNISWRVVPFLRRRTETVYDLFDGRSHIPANQVSVSVKVRRYRQPPSACLPTAS